MRICFDTLEDFIKYYNDVNNNLSLNGSLESYTGRLIMVRDGKIETRIDGDGYACFKRMTRSYLCIKVK